MGRPVLAEAIPDKPRKVQGELSGPRRRPPIRRVDGVGHRGKTLTAECPGQEDRAHEVGAEHPVLRAD
eukprot:4311266-Alexandrium_andersonii.AAC.1